MTFIYVLLLLPFDIFYFVCGPLQVSLMNQNSYCALQPKRVGIVTPTNLPFELLLYVLELLLFSYFFFLLCFFQFPCNDILYIFCFNVFATNFSCCTFHINQNNFSHDCCVTMALLDRRLIYGGPTRMFQYFIHLLPQVILAQNVPIHFILTMLSFQECGSSGPYGIPTFSFKVWRIIQHK